MLNRNCKMTFVKPEFLKKAQRANPYMYDIGCYNDNLALMIAPKSDEMIQLVQENQVVKYERLEKELLKSNTTSKNFEALQQHAIDLELALQQCQEQIKMTKISKKSVKRVIPTTSVSRPQLKSNQLEDRVMPNNSQRKKQEVEDHHRNFKFSNNKTSVNTCNDSLNAKTSNLNFVCVTCGKCVLNDNHDMFVLHYINGVNSRTKKPIVVPISTREPKRTVNQSFATPFKRTVASESTNQKPRSTVRKLYEHVSMTCSWRYPKFTPSGYKWKPKSSTMNVKPNVSMPLGNTSRTTNITESITLTGSTLSNTLKSSNSFAACRDNSIHHRLWVLKEHDEKSQASK
ncbi:hypothetical protein Tco_0631216 [Tanacetum coccineum]